MKGSVVFGGKNKRYRYRLTRAWGDGDAMCIVMLNPSTADHRKTDPTLRRCIGFAKRWGFDQLVVVNLFAFRSASPKLLRAARGNGLNPVGLHNDKHIVLAARKAKRIVVAWGNDGALEGRGAEVLALLSRRSRKPVWCLGVSKAGYPFHPLYRPENSTLVRFESP